MENTAKTTEPLLRQYDQARVITLVKIVNTPEGYVLVIQVSWRKGDLVVFNQRGRPRAWISLDRLISYLREVLPSVSKFELEMEPKLVEEENGGPTKPRTPKLQATTITSTKEVQRASAKKTPTRKSNTQG